MDQRKSQHYNYTHETVPIMWHNQTQDFLKYLDKDGIKFLRFWWKHLVENMGIKVISDPEGLGYQMKELADKDGKSVQLVLLTLPKPVDTGEVFYMLLGKFPKKITFFDMFLARLPTTRALALQLEGYEGDGTPKTGLYELTKSARNVRLGAGCEPVLDTFYKSGLKLFKL